MSEQTKKQPINLRKKPRRMVIPPSDKPTEILVTPEIGRARVWVEVPEGTRFEKADQDVVAADLLMSPAEAPSADPSAVE